MIRFACAVAVLSATALSPAIANDDSKTSTEAVQKEKKVCKTDSKTGSIMPKRVCRTKAEWDQLTEQGKTDIDRVREMERSRSMVGTAR